MNRFQQFEDGLTELVAADMSNKKTQTASHNDQSVDNLIQEFSIKRKELIAFFKSLNPKTHHHRSFHPRIKAYMKPVDLLFFIAEHDDHHLTDISEIIANR